MSGFDTGAGSGEAGIAPAGWDEAPPIGERAVKTLVAAPRFNPLTRRYDMNADGSLVDEHPVIARARHLLGIRRRSLPATPTMGFPIEGLKTAHRERRQREAEDAARLALKPLLDDDDVAILSVELSVPFDGTFYTTIRNLREPNNPPSRLAAALQG